MENTLELEVAKVEPKQFKGSVEQYLKFEGYNICNSNGYTHKSVINGDIGIVSGLFIKHQIATLFTWSQGSEKNPWLLQVHYKNEMKEMNLLKRRIETLYDVNVNCDLKEKKDFS